MLTTYESSMPRLQGADRGNYSIRYQLNVAADNRADTASPQTTYTAGVGSQMAQYTLPDTGQDRTDGRTDCSIAYSPPLP